MKGFLLAVILLLPATAFSQGVMPTVLAERDRAEVVDRWLEERFETVIPMLMNREEVDVWVVVSREYNEDPVIKTMLPATWMAARRRTILIFRRTPDGSFDRSAVSRYAVGSSFPSSWVPEEEPDQWKRATEIIAEFDPQAIAVNMSNTFGLADGITRTEYDNLVRALPEGLKDRVVSGENLAVGWLETRTPGEMAVYPMIVRIAHEIIAEGFSEAVVQPGVTSSEDVEWWYRDRIRSLGLDTWFHPSVDVQRADDPERDGEFSSREDAQVILPGDLLHVDFGIKYLR
ncbi:MAG: Xaa-Pro aminopeptidase, partial [Rhodothermales bacterium]|nr:Xaa-Pro aminopeptidase [Rhodothermales bacterium]